MPYNGRPDAMGLFDLFRNEYHLHDGIMTTMPDGVRQYADEALAEAKEGNYLTAIGIYKKIIPDYPDLEILRNNMGCCLAGLEMFDEAETAFIEAIRISRVKRDGGVCVPRSYPKEPTRNLIKLYKTVLAKKKYDPNTRCLPGNRISFHRLLATGIQRIIRSIRRQGAGAVLKKIPSYLYIRLNPVIRWHDRIFALRSEEFDRKNNITTAGIIYQTDLRINNQNQAHAVYYQGSDALLFNNALSSLKIDFNDYTFIDFGSGKGKALFLAAAYPFKKIIGIEFSEALDAVARENIRQFKKNNIEAYCMDVVDYKIPEGSVVCYFYDPFDEYIMSKVIGTIREANNFYGKSIVIVYYIARFSRLFDAEPWLERLDHIGPIMMWASNKHRSPHK